jgi:hypothetical protein
VADRLAFGLRWRQPVAAVIGFGTERTAKPLIFVSHAGKDSCAAGSVGGACIEALERRGFEVWLDKDRLEPAMEWRAELFLHLAQCDGAVILMSEDALKSDYVRYEASILTWRHWLTRKTAPTIVAVMLSDIGASKLEANGFGPCRIRDLQNVEPKPAGHDAPKDYARAVVKAFDGLRPTFPSDGLAWWAGEVAHRLSGASDEGLRRAALTLELGSYGGTEQTHRRNVAYSLLIGDLKRAHDALQWIAPGVKDEDWQRVVGYVSPIWVNVHAAHTVAEAAMRPEERPVLVIRHADKQREGEDYLRRASCHSPVLRVINAVGALGEHAVEDAFAAYESAIATRLHLDEIGTLEDQLDFMTRQPSAYCVPVCREGLDDDELRELLERLTARFPYLVFVLLPGPDVPPGPYGDREPLEVRPELNPRETRDSRWWRDELSRLKEG